jgi:hypothetical protein
VLTVVVLESQNDLIINDNYMESLTKEARLTLFSMTFVTPVITEKGGSPSLFLLAHHLPEDFKYSKTLQRFSLLYTAEHYI